MTDYDLDYTLAWLQSLEIEDEKKGMTREELMSGINRLAEENGFLKFCRKHLEEMSDGSLEEVYNLYLRRSIK